MKVISLLSGGIDSPVASYLMLKKDIEVTLLHMDNRPFTDDNTYANVIALAEKLESISKQKIKLYVAPHGINQIEFARNCNRKLQCLLCRRLMFRVAAAVAKKENAQAIVTGESLGQVASQTLQNLMVVTGAVNFPILKPLIGFDKEDIIKIARDIGTYKISIRPNLCCTIVPKKPATSAKLEHVLKEEEKVDIEKMVNDSLKNLKVEDVYIQTL